MNGGTSLTGAGAPRGRETRETITRFLFLADAPRAVDLCPVLGCPSVVSMDPAIDLFRRGRVPGPIGVKTTIGRLSPEEEGLVEVFFDVAFEQVLVVEVLEP